MATNTNMERPENRKRLEELDKKSNEELLRLIGELTAECEEKRKSCTKLQSEVRLIQSNLAESNSSRAAKMTEYSESLHLLPLAQKANAAKQRISELEMELKDTKESKDDRQQRHQELQADIRGLHAERNQLENNYTALMENLTNVKSQMESLKGQPQPETSRSLTRREADERLDDLVRQYLPEKLFKSRRRDDQ